MFETHNKINNETGKVICTFTERSRRYYGTNVNETGLITVNSLSFKKNKTTAELCKNDFYPR